MLKRFCDICETEMTKENTPFSGANNCRLQAELKAKTALLTVEVITSNLGVANSGDFCKYCILDALYALDDRPKKVTP